MNDLREDGVTVFIKAFKMISGMRQVWFASAMRCNKHQGELIQTLLQKSQIKIVIVTKDKKIDSFLGHIIQKVVSLMTGHKMDKCSPHCRTGF